MEVLCTRSASGALIPMDDVEAAKLKKLKTGGVVRATIEQMRNGPYFRKWWALAKFAFDVASETVEPMEYRGQPVQPDFERFRKDLTILAGFYRPVFNARGEMRIEAESLKWSTMTEDRFDALYSATINAVLQKVLHNSKFTEAEIRAHVDRVMLFD